MRATERRWTPRRPRTQAHGRRRPGCGTRSARSAWTPPATSRRASRAAGSRSSARAALARRPTTARDAGRPPRAMPSSWGRLPLVRLAVPHPLPFRGSASPDDPRLVSPARQARASRSSGRCWHGRAPLHCWRARPRTMHPRTHCAPACRPTFSVHMGARRSPTSWPGSTDPNRRRDLALPDPTRRALITERPEPPRGRPGRRRIVVVLDRRGPLGALDAVHGGRLPDQRRRRCDCRRFPRIPRIACRRAGARRAVHRPAGRRR